jgi:hypothetical protein
MNNELILVPQDGDNIKELIHLALKLVKHKEISLVKIDDFNGVSVYVTNESTFGTCIDEFSYKIEQINLEDGPF